MSNLAIDRVTSDAGARGACDVPAAAVQRPRWLSRARLFLALSLAAASVAFVVRSRAAAHAAVPPSIRRGGRRHARRPDHRRAAGRHRRGRRRGGVRRPLQGPREPGRGRPPLGQNGLRQGVDVPELLEREVNAKVAMPDRDALRQLYAAAQARGRVSPDISFEAAEAGFTRRIPRPGGAGEQARVRRAPAKETWGPDQPARARSSSETPSRPSARRSAPRAPR